MATVKKIDLHVHSKFSNRPQIYMLSKVKTGECYTDPETVYETCKSRGMDYVTLTDHDTIDGALEIAHHADAFLSEEITAWFPEDKTDVHVVALDIDEAQHKEISKLRFNIRELAAYMRSERIPHYVAHPLSEESRALKPGHIEQLLLLFKHFEGRNGSRDRLGGESFRRILRQLTPGHLMRWAETHRLEPEDWQVRRYLTGGSDDHGRLSIARAWTEFDTDKPGIAGIRDAFFSGKIQMGGQWGSPDLLSHNIYYVTVQYFAETAGRSAFSSFIDEEREENGSELSTPAAYRYRVLKDIVEDELTALSEVPDFDLSRLIEESRTDAVQEALGGLGRSVLHRFLSHFMGELIEGIKNIDFDRALDSLPGLLTGGSVLLPYLFGYRYYVNDREASDKLAADMGFGWSDETPRTVIFSDTGFDVNGVTLSLRNLSAAVRKKGHRADLVFCDNPPKNRGAEWLRLAEYVHVLPPIGVFELPGYSEMEMGVPSLIDVMAFLARERTAVVQLSTPGPLGLVAGLAARLMGIPVVANFHTQVHKFAAQIIGDEKITAIVSGWVGWFYRQADRVIVPSRAAGKDLEALGVNPNKVSVLPRGVDMERFHPKKRAASRNLAFDMPLPGGPTALYVGRVSKEKGLDTLMEAFVLLLKKRPDAALVVVGDGPYLSELSARYACDNIFFAGYRHGEELARMYASADLLAFPSENDTFGNAVTEAHASGLPVIVTDRGGPVEQVTHGENGWVVPAGDRAAFTAALDRLFGDEKLRVRMGKAGRQRVEKLTWDRAAEAQWRFYMEVWGRDPSVAPCPDTPADASWVGRSAS